MTLVTVARLRPALLTTTLLRHALLTVARLRHALLTVARLRHALLTVARLRHAMARMPPLMAIERLRGAPLAYLPALMALALAGVSLPARAQIGLMTLCSGGQVPLPGNRPGQRPDCDGFCHTGCTRQKRPGASREL